MMVHPNSLGMKNLNNFLRTIAVLIFLYSISIAIPGLSGRVSAQSWCINTRCEEEPILGCHCPNSWCNPESGRCEYTGGTTNPTPTPAPAGDIAMYGWLATINICTQEAPPWNHFFYGGCSGGNGCPNLDTACYRGAQGLDERRYTINWKYEGETVWKTTQSQALGHGPGFMFPDIPRPTTTGKNVIFKVNLNGLESTISNFNHWWSDRCGPNNGDGVCHFGTHAGHIYRDEAMTQLIGTRTSEITDRPREFYFKMVNYPYRDMCGEELCDRTQIGVYDYRWCGDGVRHSLNSYNGVEECDDGNNLNGDGCSQTCKIEPPPPNMRCTSKQAFRQGSSTPLPANAPVQRGEIIRYRVSYENASTTTAPSWGILDWASGDRFTFYSSPDGRCSQHHQVVNLIDCLIGNVPGNSTGFVDYYVQIKPDAQLGVFNNEATANYPGGPDWCRAYLTVVASPTITPRPPTSTPTRPPTPTPIPTNTPTTTPTRPPTPTPSRTPTPPVSTITPTKKPTVTPTKKVTVTPTKKVTPTPKKTTNSYKFRIIAKSSPKPAMQILFHGGCTGAPNSCTKDASVKEFRVYRWTAPNVPPSGCVTTNSDRTANNNVGFWTLRNTTDNSQQTFSDPAITKNVRYYYRLIGVPSSSTGRTTCPTTADVTPANYPGYSTLLGGQVVNGAPAMVTIVWTPIRTVLGAESTDVGGFLYNVVRFLIQK